MPDVSAICGGAGGVGRATSIALAKDTIIVIGDLLQENIDSTSEVLTSLNIEHHTMLMDVRDRKSCDEFAAYAASFGSIRNAINIAGVGPSTTYTEAPYSTCRETYDTNSVGALNTLEAFFPYLSEGSVMIQTASQASYHTNPDENMMDVFKSCYEDGFLDRMCSLTVYLIDEPEDEAEANGQAYCISKRFVRELVWANTWRFAKKGARILSISPGMHWTCHVWDLSEESRQGNLNLTPLGTYGRTVDLGQIFAFFCSDTARYVTSSDILVDGGGLTSFFGWRVD